MYIYDHIYIYIYMYIYTYTAQDTFFHYSPKRETSGHEPCCVTIYQSSLLVAFCKIYPLQISYLGLEALDKNA